MGLGNCTSTISSSDTEAISVSVQEGVSVSVLYGLNFYVKGIMKEVSVMVLVRIPRLTVQYSAVLTELTVSYS